MKLWGNTVPMDVNAGENRFANFNEYTVYPSPYVVADVHGYTKHYYAGTERLCSRIGGGGLQELHYSPMDDGYVEKKENAYRNLINEDLRCAGARAETKELKFEMLHRLSEIEEPETKIYYYHSDHLGSASWITDSSGQAVQHMQYLPYGETKLDQRTSSYHERYTFTGKEKDSETGYYYFGARYYNPDLSLWLSVDPMADKYPSLSPYNYCAWNPMKLIDPDGAEMDEWKIDKCGNIVERIENNNFDQIHIVDDEGNTIASSRRYELGTISEVSFANSNATVFSVCGNNNSEELFQFLAANYTSDGGYPLEWANSSLARSTDESNILGTNHGEHSIHMFSDLSSNGYSISEGSHNHPNGDPMPSGSSGSRTKDIGAAVVHEKKNPGIRLFTYTPRTGYSEYNSSGCLDDRMANKWKNATWQGKGE